MYSMTFPEFLEKKYLEWQLKEEGRKTIVQFAAYIGVSQPILSMWLNGKKRPGVENIKLLADIFGFEVYDALGIKRPNPYLQRINRVFEFLPEEMQQRIAEEAERYETKNETDRVEKAHQRGKKSKAK
jgi:transcriptional regulator with XRE-family HTH domain